ncbi:MAG TPA: hypothetical protein VFN67_33440 [Polyangiales bacterium]|nr:hypothetical protein [Polyangiales bacterium]
MCYSCVAMMRGSGCAQLAVLVLAFTAGAAFADEPVELTWSAPAECPDRNWVLRSIAARSNSSAAQPTAAVQASARVVRKGDVFQLTLQTHEGERQLSAASCEELAGSAALILAFIADPRREATPVGERAEMPAAVPDAAAAESGEAPPPLDVSGYARADWLVDVGMLPHAATGPGIALGLTIANTSFELAAGFLLNNSVRYVAAGGGGQQTLAQLHAFAAQLGVCQRLIGGGANLGLCLFGEHMRVVADPDEALRSRTTPSAPVWTVLAAARLAVPIGTRLAWYVELGLGVPVRGARFRVSRIGVIHETGDVVGRLRTGLGFSF